MKIYDWITPKFLIITGLVIAGFRKWSHVQGSIASKRVEKIYYRICHAVASAPGLGRWDTNLHKTFMRYVKDS